MHLTPRIYAVAGLIIGYVLVMLANPVRLALRDGFRCLARYERIWLTFSSAGLCLTFVFSSLPLAHSPARLKSISRRSFPFPASRLAAPLLTSGGMFRLPTLEGVAGIFDNATTTYPPLSALATIYFSLTGAVYACGELYPTFTGGGAFQSISCFSLVTAAPQATLSIGGCRGLEQSISTAHLLKNFRIHRDALSFIFEYLAGVYIQVT